MLARDLEISQEFVAYEANFKIWWKRVAEEETWLLKKVQFLLIFLSGKCHTIVRMFRRHESREKWVYRLLWRLWGKRIIIISAPIRRNRLRTYHWSLPSPKRPYQSPHLGLITIISHSFIYQCRSFASGWPCGFVVVIKRNSFVCIWYTSVFPKYWQTGMNMVHAIVWLQTLRATQNRFHALLSYVVCHLKICSQHKRKL